MYQLAKYRHKLSNIAGGSNIISRQTFDHLSPQAQADLFKREYLRLKIGGAASAADVELIKETFRPIFKKIGWKLWPWVKDSLKTNITEKELNDWLDAADSERVKEENILKKKGSNHTDLEIVSVAKLNTDKQKVRELLTKINRLELLKNAILKDETIKNEISENYSPFLTQRLTFFQNLIQGGDICCIQEDDFLPCILHRNPGNAGFVPINGVKIGYVRQQQKIGIKNTAANVNNMKKESKEEHPILHIGYENWMNDGVTIYFNASKFILLGCMCGYVDIENKTAYAIAMLQQGEYIFVVATTHLESGRDKVKKEEKRCKDIKAFLQRIDSFNTGDFPVILGFDGNTPSNQTSLNSYYSELKGYSRDMRFMYRGLDNYQTAIDSNDGVVSVNKIRGFGTAQPLKIMDHEYHCIDYVMFKGFADSTNSHRFGQSGVKYKIMKKVKLPKKETTGDKGKNWLMGPGKINGKILEVHEMYRTRNVQQSVLDSEAHPPKKGFSDHLPLICSFKIHENEEFNFTQFNALGLGFTNEGFQQPI